MKNQKRSLLIGLLFCSLPALAAKPGTPTVADVLDASGISVTGYIDTSYTSLSGTGAFTSGVPNRVYDNESNSFNLHMIDLMVSSLPEKGFGALVDLNFGSDANVHAATGTGNTDEFDVLQGYLQYAQGPITVLAGKFTTLAGFETVKSPDNFNFSRSILFGYAVPFTHTGVRASYVVSPVLKFTAGINNGWDVVKESQSERDKTLEFGVGIVPMKDLNLNVAIYRGEEPIVAGGRGGMRTLFDFVGSYNITSALTVAINTDLGTQEDAAPTGADADWYGIAGYVNYRINDLWRVAGRVEQFSDSDAYRTGIKQDWQEATVTVGYTPDKRVELRGEIRNDMSNESVFTRYDGGPKKSQQSLALEALYKF